MKSIKAVFIVLTLFLLWGNSFGQTTALVNNSNLMESHGIMSFKPMGIMATPQTLMKVWIDEPIPVDFYSDKEKEVQKLINEKTTDGIITYSPLDKEKEWTSVDYEEITPFTWKWVDFELPKPEGTLTKINLRTPHWWLKEIGADSVGKKVYLNMPELGCSQGWATVTAIRVNQLDTRFWDESRDGDYVSRPITGKFTHESNDVYNLHFGDNAKSLGVTGSHPIWSVDRNDWVGATDLKIGEKVKTQEGEVTLKSKEKVEGRQKVYNLEVYKDHNFCFGTKMKGGGFFPKRAKDLSKKLGISESEWYNSVNGGLKADLKSTLGFNTKKVSSKYENNPDFGLSSDGKSLLFRSTNGKFKEQTYDTGLTIDDVSKMIE